MILVLLQFSNFTEIQTEEPKHPINSGYMGHILTIAAGQYTLHGTFANKCQMSSHKIQCILSSVFFLICTTVNVLTCIHMYSV